MSTGLSVKVAYDTASRVSGIDYKAGSSNNEKSTDFVLFPSGAHKRVTRNGAGFSADNAVSGSTAFPQVYENYVEDVPGSTDTTWHEVVDANGNRKNFYPGGATNDGHTYIYDQDNRLVSYSDLNDVVTTYAYDAFGRRIAKTTGSNTTRYVYAGWDVIQERNGSNGLLRSFLLSGQATDGVVAMTTHNPSTGAATASYFYLKDARGNVVALATPAGAVVERYVYDAYGTPTVYNTAWGSPTSQSPLGNPYLFQSRNYDSESGLYYYRLRYMDPLVGRFITPDPIGNWGDAANLGNPYTFVGNNPWTYSDPLGLERNPFSPEWHHVFPTEVFGNLYDNLDEAWNGFWLPSMFHNWEGTGIHNTIKDFGLDWNAQWDYYLKSYEAYGIDWRNDHALLLYTAERMKKIPRFAPAFAVGKPAKVPYTPFFDRSLEENKGFREEATKCAGEMYDKAKELGMLKKSGVLRAMASAKRGIAALGLGLGILAAASDANAYGVEEAAKRNSPGVGVYYLAQDGAWWFGERVASGGLVPGYVGDINDSWNPSEGSGGSFVPEDWDDFWAGFDGWNRR